MSSTDVSQSQGEDRLAQLQRQIMNYRPLHPVYLYASLLCSAIGGASSIIRYYNGWSYETAGVWVNLGFWGGYLLGLMIAIPVVVLGWINGRKLDKAMQEFQKEKARRGLTSRSGDAASVPGETGKRTT